MSNKPKTPKLTSTINTLHDFEEKKEKLQNTLLTKYVVSEMLRTGNINVKDKEPEKRQFGFLVMSIDSINEKQAMETKLKKTLKSVLEKQGGAL